MKVTGTSGTCSPSQLAWPHLQLTLALLKPNAPAEAIIGLPERGHTVLRHAQVTLTIGDIRRLYPEAYGAQYVAARDDYMTSGPSHILLLRRDTSEPSKQIKTRIRAQVGGEDLRNHLHMADNPGEALVDIAHLTGATALAQAYEEHAREGAAQRLAFYRAALGTGRPDADREPAAG